MKTFFKTLWTAMLLFIGVSASAAITSGYYRIKSNYYDGRYITENLGDHTLITSALADNNYAQVWYLDVSSNNQVTIKNALTDRYISTVSNYSEVYPTKTTSKQYTYAETNGTYTFAEDNGYGLHCAATQSYNVVRWYTNAEASVWTIEPASVNQTELNSQKNALQEATTAQLTNFFTSTACTELKSTYTNYTDANLRSAMSSLPTSVQNLAIKVKNNSWTTYSGWDKTEKTFRVADYKPYSNGDRWTTILGHKHHLGRLSNPTGIYAEAGDFLQVYVGAIPSGQTVKFEIAGFGQAAGATYSLHEGMNVVLASSSGNCFVFYEVDNTTNGSTPYKLMSEYADVTVHIEGGTVQGYLDLTKGDDDDDWTQMNNHLLSKETVCLKSTKNVMNLYKEWLLTALNGSSVVDMVNVWKNLSEWEDELIGRSDTQGQTTYGQYCNNVTSVTSLPGNGSPHASHYGTFYYDYSHNAIFNANALMTVADNMWCIAHEQGHNRQGPINMVGNTEISNNLFSNVAIYKQGRYTSRTASIQMTFQDFQNGMSWPERIAKYVNDGNGNYNQQLLHLNWQLYLFFHVNGNVPDFFPRLFDALRADQMTNVSGENTLTPASTDYLKYYQKCCKVSGYDLTDFFAAYGFFMLPPEQETSINYNNVTTKRYVTLNDYSTYNIYVTQEMIDNAKTAVANMNLPQCNIIFIEDRVTAPDATYEGAPAGTKKTINPDSPVKAFGECGEMGQYTDFDVTPSPYTFNVTERGNVAAVGTGAVGFKVYDSSGNLVGFYNTSTFTPPPGLTNYTIKAAAGDGTDAVVTKDASIVVSDFPKTDMWYAFNAKRAPGRYVESKGVGTGIVGTTSSTFSNTMQWKFVLRENEAETFDIVNRDDNSYVDPTASDNTQIFTTTTQPTSGWKVTSVGNYYIITSGTTQFNQTQSAQDYKLYNWGSGSNSTDEGCLFTITEVEQFETYDLQVSSTAADNLSTNTWYVMYNRGGWRGYLYEDNSSNRLYNTINTEPGLVGAPYERYLVRLSDAGNGKYYIETGYGNFFQALSTNDNTPVTTGATKEAFTVAKINSTDGHFYVQGTNSVILDASAATPNDAYVVSYGTTIPTKLNGNNDWAFYPVTLVPHFAPTSTDIFTINNLNSGRGAMTYDAANSEKFVWSSGKGGATAFNAESANCQWIFVPTETANQYYLYNVGKQKFVVPTKSGSWSNSNYTWMFSSDAVPVQLFLQSDGTYKINTVTGSIYLSVSNSYTGPIINFNDAGSEFTITKQGYASNAVSTQLATAIAAKPGATKTMALNTVGGKSYATLYLDYDAQTDADTKAYYITEANGGYTQLTLVDNEGRNIPAYTAVVLINENGTANPTFNTGFSVSNGYTEAVAENTNLLKGTLVSMELDLGETTPNYSLGNNNGIGFYKFNDGYTSIITLGANKAYLQTGANTSKGFIFTFDDATAIAPIVNGQSSMVNDNWYTLDGRKLSGKPTMPGIYINNGKKIMIH